MYALISSLLVNSALALPLYGEVALENQDDPNHCKVDHQGMQSSGSPWTSFGQHVDQEVYVYVSENFAYSYNILMGDRCASDPDCTDVQTITQDQGRNIVMNAMEVWNRESRGPALVYAGETEFGLRERHVLSGGTCEDFLEYGAPDGGPIQLPAVIVDATSVSAAGGVMGLKTSDGAWCYDEVDGFEGVISLDVGNISVRSIRTTMVHEFGHVLGLGHAWGDFYDECYYSDKNDVYDGPPSVMLYDFNEYNADTGDGFYHRHQWRGHLWPYDVDCVDDDMGAETAAEQEDGRLRSLQYGWWTYKPIGNTWSTLQTSDWLNTSKSFSGGIMQPTTAEGGDVVSMFYANPWFEETYATWLYPKDFQSGSTADNEMYMDYNAEIFEEDSRNEYRPFDSWIAPTMYAMYNETSYSDSNDWLIAFPQALRSGEPDNADIDDVDPPLWIVQGGERPGDNSHNGGLHHDMTTIAYENGAWTYGELRSHVSPRITWDPVSKQTIVATVNTRECEGYAHTFNYTQPYHQNRCGGIVIYPYTTSHYLLYPETMTIGYSQSFITVPEYKIDDPTNGAFDQGYTTLEEHAYTATTDVAPAIACAPKAHHNADEDANCLLAWVDNGTPDGHILYAYFSVSGATVTWGDAIHVLRPDETLYRDRDAYSIGELQDNNGAPSQSQSDLSAIYSDGRFFIAFKNSSGEYTESVTLVQTDYRDLDFWSIQNVWTESQTIEAPTFVHDPTDENREWSLVWNETDWGL